MMHRGLLAGTLLLLAVPVTSLCKTAPDRPLRFSLIDQLPFQAEVTGVNSLEERRRLTVFNAALQDAVRAGKLPPSILINQEVSLRAGRANETPQPPGTLVVRLFLTQWAQTASGGAANAEVLCRFFVEEVSAGKKPVRLGPFLGRVRTNEAVVPLHQDQFAVYQAAARQALDQLAARLSHTP